MKIELGFKIDDTREVSCGADTTTKVEVIQEWIDTLKMAQDWLKVGKVYNAKSI